MTQSGRRGKKTFARQLKEKSFRVKTNEFASTEKIVPRRIQYQILNRVKETDHNLVEKKLKLKSYEESKYFFQSLHRRKF